MKKKTITGILNFYTWFYPWILISKEGKKQNFFPEVEKLFKALNGKPVSFIKELEKFSFSHDESSEWIFKFEQDRDGTLALLNKKIGVGGSNIGAQIPEALQHINGRKVTINFTELGMELAADPSEKVFTLPYTDGGNTARIAKGKERKICKIKTTDTCIFCSLSSKTGWTCLKGDSYFARQLLYRLQNNDIQASRIGNCLIKGRVEEPTAR